MSEQEALIRERLHPDDGYSYEECNGPSCRAIRAAADQSEPLMAPLDAYARGFQDGVKAAKFDATLAADRPSGERVECPTCHYTFVPDAARPSGIGDDIENIAQRIDAVRVIDLALASQGAPDVRGDALLRDIEEGGYTLRLTMDDERAWRNRHGGSE